MSQLRTEERETIMVMLGQNQSHRAIARTLWRHNGTISKEIKRNSVRWKYSASKAEHKAYVKRKYAKYIYKKIRANDDLEDYVRKKIKNDRSPEMISWRWNKEHWNISISTVSIYKYVYSRFAYDLPEFLYSHRNWRIRRKSHNNKKWWIKHRVFIDLRPELISKLTQFGHYECDLIIGPQWTKEVLLVLIEKMTRWKIAKKLPNKKAKTIEKTLKKRVKFLWCRSITFDNWTEFSNHYKLGIPTYFSHPYHSREKAQVERGNRDYRRFFPKKTMRKKISQKDIDKITKKLNNMPMKILKFQTPKEVFQSCFKKHFPVSLLTL